MSEPPQRFTGTVVSVHRDKPFLFYVTPSDGGADVCGHTKAIRGSRYGSPAPAPGSTVEYGLQSHAGPSGSQARAVPTDVVVSAPPPADWAPLPQRQRQRQRPARRGGGRQGGKRQKSKRKPPFAGERPDYAAGGAPFEAGVSVLGIDCGGVLSVTDTDAGVNAESMTQGQAGDLQLQVLQTPPAASTVEAVRRLVERFGAERVFVISKCGTGP